MNKIQSLQVCSFIIGTKEYGFEKTNLKVLKITHSFDRCGHCYRSSPVFKWYDPMTSDLEVIDHYPVFLKTVLYHLISERNHQKKNKDDRKIEDIRDGYKKARPKVI